MTWLLIPSSPAQPTGAGWALLGLLLVALVLATVLGGLWWQQRRKAQQLRRELSTLETQSHQRLDSEDPEVPGLYSRPRFDALLEKATRLADRKKTTVVLLFVNLDNFRSVNERHNYQTGDQVILQAAQRLLACAGPRPVAARLGADEFLLLHRGELDAACALAARLCQALARGYDLPGRSAALPLACSIGLAAYPLHGSRSRLVSFAAQAMLAVKRAGGDDYMVFEPRMAINQREQAELLGDLRQAVALGQLELFYQPKVDALTLHVTAAEALLRWHHPQRGMVSPSVFIPLAERSGLISGIGNWVIDDACRQAAVWRDAGLRMRVAINLSAYQMRQDDLVDRIEAALQRHRLRPERFTVEITESVAMEDTQVTQRSFQRLRSAGLHVSIDDFGVGQASLSYLRQLPAAELKIDASFVREVDSRSDAHAIVDAVVRLAHALGLKVVAEGVETEGQRDALVALGCNELQGFLFAKPMSATALGTWALLEANEPGGQTPGQPRSGSFSRSLFLETRPQTDLSS
jgi:diguanylate cyclase (GGDEF)-like protein